MKGAGTDRGQLRLLPSPQPLVERLGEAFFRGIPEAPGVYRMYDAGGGLVYVGKALDLRARLGSYRRTSGQSRKTVRLIHAVFRIEWDVCGTETEALLLENRWIRVARPRFNRAGVWPRSARYIRHERESGGGERWVLAEEGGGESEGPFRGGPGRVLAVLARLVWLAGGGGAAAGGGVMALPRRLLKAEMSRELRLGSAPAAVWSEGIRDYLAGARDDVVGRLAAVIPEPGTRFEMAFLGGEFEFLQAFYRAGPRVTRGLRERFGGGEEAVSAEVLDDWRIRAGKAGGPPPFRPE